MHSAITATLLPPQLRQLLNGTLDEPLYFNINGEGHKLGHDIFQLYVHWFVGLLVEELPEDGGFGGSVEVFQQDDQHFAEGYVADWV